MRTVTIDQERLRRVGEAAAYHAVRAELRRQVGDQLPARWHVHISGFPFTMTLETELPTSPDLNFEWAR